MLRLARERAASGAQFEAGDITSVQLKETFDAVLIMFAVLGYLTDNAAVEAALRAARTHLPTGGIVFGDVWYGPAVLSQRPSERVKVIDLADHGQIIRVARSELDVRRNVCTVEYRLWRLQGERVCATATERHMMRYFFEPELSLFLKDSGFELERVGAFPELDDAPSEQTWNIGFIARAH
jgi:SAM-dependent methyltransferase